MNETMMENCPQCGATIGEELKNCPGCRINLYWAAQHYTELAARRATSSLAPRSETASFLLETSKRVDDGPTAGWLRQIVRKVGLREAGKKVSTIL